MDNRTRRLLFDDSKIKKINAGRAPKVTGATTARCARCNLYSLVVIGEHCVKCARALDAMEKTGRLDTPAA